MSYQRFVKAMENAPKCKYFTTVGGKTKEEIIKSEQILGIKFSQQCGEFYEKYGYLSFYGCEVYRIDPEDDSGILEGNSVAYAINDRKKYKLPQEWIPIYNFEDGHMAYLDYSTKNAQKEPRVIRAFYNGKKYEVVELLSEDFGDFIFQLIQEHLKSL